MLPNTQLNTGFCVMDFSGREVYAKICILGYIHLFNLPKINSTKNQGDLFSTRGPGINMCVGVLQHQHICDQYSFQANDYVIGQLELEQSTRTRTDSFPRLL